MKNTLKRWGKDRTPDVILGLYRNAVQQGHAADALAWMKLIEDWQDKSEVNVHYAQLKELQDITRKLFDKEKEKNKDN